MVETFEYRVEAPGGEIITGTIDAATDADARRMQREEYDWRPILHVVRTANLSLGVAVAGFASLIVLLLTLRRFGPGRRASNRLLLMVPVIGRTVCYVERSGRHPPARALVCSSGRLDRAVSKSRGCVPGDGDCD